MKQDVIYVTGHQHPDTDSIAAAIGYAFFKRANGVKAIPCRLGKIGTETRYLLDRFGFEEPMLLEDARVKMSEIEIDEPTTIMPDKTIFEAIQLMHGAGKQTCGVVDAEDRVLNDRIHLSEDGCLAIAITVDDSTGNLACPPSINSIGCFDGESTEAVHEAISAKCATLLKSAGSKAGSVEAFVEKRAVARQPKMSKRTPKCARKNGISRLFTRIFPRGAGA